MTIEKVKSICQSRLRELGLDYDLKYQERVKEELSDLAVWEKIGVAKATRLLSSVGDHPPAKTNKSASLILFLIGLTEVDPIKDGLPLRRDLIQCDSPPDIDTDFDPEIRDIVKAKVVDTFGKDNVCSIGTYQTYKTRAVIVEVAKALGYDGNEISAITKELEPLKAFEGEDGEECIVDKMPFDQVCSHYPALKEYLDKHPDILRHALVLRNQVRNTGRHAGGLIISDLALKDKIPVFQTSDGDIVSSWSESGNASELSSVGLIKYDILGLKNLTVVSDCVKLIEETRGIKLRKADIPINDREAIRLEARSDLVGIFQFENPATKEIVDAVGVDCLNDISAVTSLLRPGPKDMGMHMEYADRKNGKKQYKIKECLKPILLETYGVLTYQEQAMRISRALAGFTGPESNKLRKLMGKKKPEEIKKMREKFVQGSQPKIDSGEFTLEEVEEMWKLIESFAGYAFNKCLCPSSVVETPGGLRLLKEIRIGDMVLTPGNVYAEVVDVIDSGNQELWEFTTSSGKMIRCTLSHKFLCSDGVVRSMRDVIDGDYDIVSEDE
jgi:DNA polymerase-3 subunit alpha